MNQLDQWASAMRTDPTYAEYRLMLALSRAITKYPAFSPAGKLLCQHVLHGKILDFYFPKISLCIEVDGGYHNQEAQKKRDNDRDLLLKDYGIRTVRTTNEEVLKTPNKVARDLLSAALNIPNPAHGKDRKVKTGMPVNLPNGCVKIKRIKYSLLSREC
jgi:very-short-patch-repair endonuclease